MWIFAIYRTWSHDLAMLWSTYDLLNIKEKYALIEFGVSNYLIF